MKKESVYWAVFVLVKCTYMILAITVYSKHTVLGDTERYLSGGDGGAAGLSSTYLMDVVAGAFGTLFGGVWGNIPFVFLAAFGVYYPIKKLGVSAREQVALLVLLSTPSFGIWTSIASKESVSVFFMGGILSFVICLINKEKKYSYIYVLFSFGLCILFKPQYMTAILALLLYVLITGSVRTHVSIKFLVLVCFFLGSLLSLYIFRYEINELAFIIPSHFSLDGGSTRHNTIWVRDFDVFVNAPYGMLIAFVGPTIDEAFSKPTHMLVWLESMLIVGLFICYSLKMVMASLHHRVINIHYFSIFLIPSLWILFVHYPFGVLNPGSAIRYREGFYAFFVILYYFCYVRTMRSLSSSASRSIDG